MSYKISYKQLKNEYLTLRGGMENPRLSSIPKFRRTSAPDISKLQGNMWSGITEGENPGEKGEAPGVIVIQPGAPRAKSNTMEETKLPGNTPEEIIRNLIEKRKDEVIITAEQKLADIQTLTELAKKYELKNWADGKEYNWKSIQKKCRKKSLRKVIAANFTRREDEDVDSFNIRKRDIFFNWETRLNDEQKNTVSTLYEDAMREVNADRRKIIQLLVPATCFRCEPSDSGNNELTSDIDVSLHYKVPEVMNGKTYYIPYHTIRTINSFFIQVFGVSSETLFDINFYSHSHFFPLNIERITVLTPNKHDRYHIDFSEIMRNHESILRIQEFFATLKIYQNLALPSKSKVEFPMSTFTEQFFDIGIEYLSNMLGKNINLNNLTKEEKIKEIAYYGQENNHDMYVKILRMVNNKIADIMKLDLEDPITIERHKYHLVNLITFAAPFSSESYYTYGALMHVVYLRQRAMNISLSKEFYIHSMLENYGDFIHKIKNIKSDNEFYILIEASKYVARIYDAIMLYYGGNHSEYMSKYTTMDYIGSIFRRNIPETITSTSSEYKKIYDFITKSLFKSFKIPDSLHNRAFPLNYIISKVINDISKVYKEFCKGKAIEDMICITCESLNPVFDNSIIESISARSSPVPMETATSLLEHPIELLSASSSSSTSALVPMRPASRKSLS